MPSNRVLGVTTAHNIQLLSKSRDQHDVSGTIQFKYNDEMDVTIRNKDAQAETECAISEFERKRRKSLGNMKKTRSPPAWCVHAIIQGENKNCPLRSIVSQHSRTRSFHRSAVSPRAPNLMRHALCSEVSLPPGFCCSIRWRSAMQASLHRVLDGRPFDVCCIQNSHFLIGRDKECQLRPPGPFVSNVHCEVLWKNCRVFVRDLDSEYGTYVNRRQVECDRKLATGDILSVGLVDYEIRIAQTKLDGRRDSKHLQRLRFQLGRWLTLLPTPECG